MATRSQAREAVVCLLYARDCGNCDVRKFAIDILEDKKIRHKQQEFALGLFDGVSGCEESVDLAISAHLKDWDLKKLGGMERAILRLGAYEILHTDTDKAVIINEAIELAKNYGEEMAPRLINGILDAIKK